MTMSVAFSTLDVPTADGNADSYLARPDDGTAHPGVLFYMDAYGLRPWLREMMEAIAAHGYTVLAPNIFYRTGRAPILPMPDSADPAAHAKFFVALGPARAALTPDKAVVYPNTRHGFTMRDTPVFDQAAYDRHLTDLLALLRRASPST